MLSPTQSGSTMTDYERRCEMNRNYKTADDFRNRRISIPVGLCECFSMGVLFATFIVLCSVM